MITYDRIMYNQTTGDDAVGKDKNIARGDFIPAQRTSKCINTEFHEL